MKSYKSQPKNNKSAVPLMSLGRSIVQSAKWSLNLKTSGDPSRQPIVFLHGWPDDDTLWQPFIDKLSSRYYCITLCWPNFAGRVSRRLGYRIPELADLAVHALEEHGIKQKVILVTHDWGALIGYHIERKHPDKVESMVSMDVALRFKKNVVNLALMVSYQAPLVISWGIGLVLPPLGTLLNKAVAMMVRAPKHRVKKTTWANGYLYFYLSLDGLLPDRSPLLDGKVPRCPTLFLYSTKSPIAFHDSKWLSDIQRSGGQSKGIKGDHWFFLSKFDEVFPLVENFIGKDDPVVERILA
ncbi:alpha/beta hydrolase [Veronia nyctiphanis]|nr:alpha/beta hydrolase [Veronia nyctiphanis]